MTFAAYSCEWVPRSEIFKRSLKLFMERGNTSIVLTGWRIFPLSLDTFTSVSEHSYVTYIYYVNIFRGVLVVIVFTLLSGHSCVGRGTWGPSVKTLRFDKDT